MPTMKTIKEAAEATGLSYYTIRQWCISRQFTGFVKTGSKFLINMELLKDFLLGGGKDE